MLLNSKSLLIIFSMIFGVGLIIVMNYFPGQDYTATDVSSKTPLADQDLESPNHQESKKSADIGILFVGNSHTGFHDLPELVANLFRFSSSEKTVCTKLISVGFLEDLKNVDNFKQEIESKKWDILVLQAQKISQSGRYSYSTAEGVDIAKFAREGGMQVYFFAEWGMRGDLSSAARTEVIYRTMSLESGAKLIPVGSVWHLAQEAVPGLDLYANDGNHESRLGASLTALAIACSLLDVSANDFKQYIDPVVETNTWSVFIDAVNNTYAQENERKEGANR